MVDQSAIRAYAGTASVRKSEQVVNEALQQGKQTAFLSHSHKDSDLAKALQGFLHAHGWIVYIDWEDTSMPSRPSREDSAQDQGPDQATGLVFVPCYGNLGYKQVVPLGSGVRGRR